MRIKRSVCVVFSALICVLSLSSCTKRIEKTTYDTVTGTMDDSYTYSGTPDVTVRKIQKKIGPLLKPYDELISSGEYTLKVIVNEVIGGESIPTVTTSVHHGDRIGIRVEESYSSVIDYILEGAVLYYKTENGEKRSIEYDPYILNITLFDSDLELIEKKSMTLYGKNYDCEEYADPFGRTLSFLFNGEKLERKLVYKNSEEYTVYTVYLTENIKDVAFEF